MNVLITMTVLLGGLLFGTYTTWNQYQRGKVEIERGTAAPQDVQRFLATTYASLSNVDGCKGLLSTVPFPSPIPTFNAIDPVTLSVGNTPYTLTSRVQSSSISLLAATIEACAPATTIVCDPPQSHRITLQWELTHATTQRKIRGQISNIFVTPITAGGMGVADCRFTPPNNASSGPATPMDCARFGTTLGPDGVCQTQTGVLSALGMTPMPSNTHIGQQLTAGVVSDLTPLSGSPSICGANQAATGFNVNPGNGQVSLQCASATPPPSSTPTPSPSVSCVPRPPSCLSCINGSTNGQLCYNGMWVPGTMRFLWWVGPAPGTNCCCTSGASGGCASCTIQGPMGCHSTIFGGGFGCPDHRCR